MTKHSRITPNAFRLAVLALAFAGTGSAIAAVANATSSGTVVQPITIASDANLAFGSFAASGTPGSVTVSPNGNRDKTGGVTLMAGASTAARFTITGQAGAGFSISLGGSATLSDGGGNSMPFTPVSDLVGGTITSGTVTSGTLTGGTQVLYVGGVLDVGANQVAGTYSGNIAATVDYN